MWRLRDKHSLIAFASMNIEGIRNLREEEILEKFQKYDFIALQETWSNTKNSDNFSFPGYHYEFKHCVNKHRAGRGSGGIMFLYRNKYFQSVTSLISEAFKC